MTKRFIASILRKAANLIQKNGLEKRRYGTPNGPHCVLGAIQIVLLQETGKHGDPWELPLSNGLTSGDLAPFNDLEWTTKADVVKRLRKEAFCLEHGGKTREQVKAGKGHG